MCVGEIQIRFINAVNVKQSRKNVRMESEGAVSETREPWKPVSHNHDQCEMCDHLEIRLGQAEEEVVQRGQHITTLEEEVERLRKDVLSPLREAIEPFRFLGRPDERHGIIAYHDLEDDVVVYDDKSGTAITVGHVRRLQNGLSNSKRDDGDYQP